MSVQPQASEFELPQAWRELIELGFSCFPVELRGKRPLGAWKAYQAAHPPIELVRQWASRPSNIGIATGAVSGLLVLDLDSVEAIEEAERRGMPPPSPLRRTLARFGSASPPVPFGARLRAIFSPCSTTTRRKCWADRGRARCG